MSTNLYNSKIIQTNISDIIKASIPTFDTSSMIPSLNIVTYMLEDINKSISASTDFMLDNIRASLSSLIKIQNDAISSMAKGALDSFNSINEETVEYLTNTNKETLTNSLINISDYLGDLSVPPENSQELNSYKVEIEQVVININSAPSEKVTIHTWISTVGVIITIFLGLFQLYTSQNIDTTDSKVPTELELKQQETLNLLNEYLNTLINENELEDKELHLIE